MLDTALVRSSASFGPTVYAVRTQRSRCANVAADTRHGTWFESDGWSHGSGVDTQQSRLRGCRCWGPTPHVIARRIALLIEPSYFCLFSLYKCECLTARTEKRMILYFTISIKLAGFSASYFDIVCVHKITSHLPPCVKSTQTLARLSCSYLTWTRSKLFLTLRREGKLHTIISRTRW